MKRSFVLSILIIAIFSSCSRRPHYVIPEDKMVDVLCDIRLAEAIYRDGNRFNTNKKKDALVAGVLEKHKITQAELDSSLLWYSDNMDQYMNITDSVASRLKTKNDRVMTSRMALESKHHESSNYIIPPFFYLNESTPTMSFDIDSFKIKKINLPSFCLKFDVQGLSSLQKAEAAIFFTYKDTLIRNIVLINENSNYEFAKPHLADSLLKSISGYVHIRNKVKNMPSNVLLYNISYSDSTVISLNNQPIESQPKPVETPAEVHRSIEKPVLKETDEQPIISKERIDRNPALRNRRQLPQR